MLDCKPISTPLPTKFQPSGASPLLTNVTAYCALVGSLHYITLTRPHLAYAVNFVCQFMHSPMEYHMSVAKQILKYLKATLDHGLLISASSSLDLKAYSDTDWAGYLNTRRSTSGYCIFLGSNLVSWSAKKQTRISKSSTEAEYRAMSSTTTEITQDIFLL